MEGIVLLCSVETELRSTVPFWGLGGGCCLYSGGEEPLVSVIKGKALPPPSGIASLYALSWHVLVTASLCPGATRPGE